MRTYYARIRYPATASMSFDLTYDFEDQRDSFQTLSVTTTWRF